MQERNTQEFMEIIAWEKKNKSSNRVIKIKI